MLVYDYGAGNVTGRLGQVITGKWANNEDSGNREPSGVSGGRKRFNIETNKNCGVELIFLSFYFDVLDKRINET